METQGGFLISQIKQIQGRIFERLLEQSGIQEFSGAQGRILYVLWHEDELPIVALSQRTGLAKTTLTSMLDRLESSGHIRRVPSREDRRQVIICLTDAAKGLRDSYTRVSNEMNDIFYEGFSDDEIVLFENMLRRVRANLEKKEKTW